jgi:hypothetical protein
MSRIYIVTDRADTSNVRFVRAHTIAGCLRAVAESQYHAAPATTDDVYQAMKIGAAVLDAADPEQGSL